MLSGKAEITLQGAYHHLHFVGLTSQGIFLFHLTKKGWEVVNVNCGDEMNVKLESVANRGDGGEPGLECREATLDEFSHSPTAPVRKERQLLNASIAVELVPCSSPWN